MEIWSIGTALRDPLRIPSFLNVLHNFEGWYWNNQTQLDYYIELIRQGVVSKSKISVNLLNVPQSQARSLMYNNYEDPPIRGRVLGSLFEKLGFLDFNQGIIAFTNRGTGIINGNISLSDGLIDGLIGWQYINTISQWSTVINRLPITQSFSPFIATLYLIGRVNYISGSNTGITRNEFAYFVQTIDNYALVDIFANCIINGRMNFNNISNIISYINKNVTNIDNNNDYIDNSIKYFVASTLIQSGYVQIGMNYNFANLNYSEINQIRTIVNTYIPNSLQI